MFSTSIIHFGLIEMFHRNFAFPGSIGETISFSPIEAPEQRTFPILYAVGTASIRTKVLT